MAETLNGIADLARDDGFRQRVHAAMVVAAKNVGSEAGPLGSEYHRLRREAAKDMVLGWVDELVEGFAWLTASNPVIKRSSSDDDIQFTVNSVFPVVAACGPPPAEAGSKVQE